MQAGPASHSPTLRIAITALCLAALQPVAMSDAVAAALAAALAGADAETHEYAASVAAGVLEDAAPGAAAAHTASELAEALGPILEDAGLRGDDVSALCDRLAAAHLGTTPGGSAAASSGEDMLIDLRGIILAFAGKARPVLAALGSAAAIGLTTACRFMESQAADVRPRACRARRTRFCRLCRAWAGLCSDVRRRRCEVRV